MFLVEFVQANVIYVLCYIRLICLMRHLQLFKSDFTYVCVCVCVFVCVCVCVCV